MKFIKFQPSSTEAINNKKLERVPNGYDILNNLVNLLFSTTEFNSIRFLWKFPFSAVIHEKREETPHKAQCGGQA